MNVLRRLGLAALVSLVPAAGSSWADEPPPIVVELFTSQGCSSCPPADVYLGELAGRPDILALGFHVDYFNYIGWNDPYGRPWASERQRAYQRSLNQRYVYTPQMVVNGAAQAIGSERGAVEALIRAAAASRPPHPELSLDRRENGALVVHVGAGASPPKEPATLWLIGYDRPRETRVLRGENAGETLTDYQAVQSYRRLGAWPGWSLEIVVPASVAASLGTGGIAVLLQADTAGPILNAARIDGAR